MFFIRHMNIHTNHHRRFKMLIFLSKIFQIFLCQYDVFHNCRYNMLFN